MLRVAPGLLPQTIELLRQCGQGRRECVVFWLGPASEPALADSVAHPKHLARRGYYEVDQGWYHSFCVELVRAHRSVRAQVHTHCGEAFHSETDDGGAIVQVPGFLSLVLADFAMAPDPLAEAYLARLDERGRFWHADLQAELRFDDDSA